MRLFDPEGVCNVNARTEEEVIVAITRGELAVLASSVGEAIEAIDDWEFSTRVGALPGEARALRNQISTILKELSQPD